MRILIKEQIALRLCFPSFSSAEFPKEAHQHRGTEAKVAPRGLLCMLYWLYRGPKAMAPCLQIWQKSTVPSANQHLPIMIPYDQPKASAVLQEENLRDEKARERKDYSKTFPHFCFLFALLKFSEGREESPQGEYYFEAMFPLAQMWMMLPSSTTLTGVDESLEMKFTF